MEVDLLSLLGRRSVTHPSRITSVEFTANCEVRIGVTGWPWWTEGLDTSKDHTIAFSFRGVSDGALETRDFDFEETEALETFAVVETVKLPWARSEGSAIYCHAPLPRPLRVFAAVHDFLLPYGGVRRAGHFLNSGDAESLATFVDRTSSNSYLIANAPPVIRDIVCDELAAQGVTYNELPARLQPCGRLLVTLGRSQFFCETAHVEFVD